MQQLIGTVQPQIVLTSASKHRPRLWVYFVFQRPATAWLWAYSLFRSHKDGYCYHKAGVMLLELHTPGITQRDLFADVWQEADSACSQKHMEIQDSTNHRMGPGTVFLTGQGTPHVKRPWHLRRELKSPRYTTSWRGWLRFRERE